MGHAAVDQLKIIRLEDEAKAKDAEIARLKAWAKRATTALIKVRPLGGSELFMRLGEDNVADPEWCGRAVEEMRDSLHKSRSEAAHLRNDFNALQDALVGKTGLSAIQEAHRLRKLHPLSQSE